MLTVAQFAARIGMSPRGVRKAIERGDIVATKMGRDWLIKPDQLKRYFPLDSVEQAKGRKPGRRKG